MTRDDIRATVIRLLADRAPEVDFAQLNPDRPLREQIDLDSMDYLNFLVALNKELGVAVPEKDYPKLATLNACIDYVASRQ
jgi:acyl carrier protein